MTELIIRPADRKSDATALWAIIEPIIRAGEAYPLPRDMTQKAAIAYWYSSLHTTFVIEDNRGIVLGTYYIRPNNSGGGAHIANCGYMVHADAQGKGVASSMCRHSIEYATKTGFRGIQFNFVVATNTRAIALWTSMGFETVGHLPQVFNHPRLGYVDALVMFKSLVG